jgi:error-prone DNA polymerase
MVRLFRDRPDALVRTVEIAGASSFSLDELRYVYPDEFLPTGKTAQGYLEELAREGAARRYPGGVPAEVTRQIEHELRLIRELSFADYFLTIWDIVTYARSQGILCQGRGSAANSAVCYALGITAIDPVRMDLLFERFISAERGEPPDIDVDFEHERREEVIQYIYRRYGRERAGMVCEVISYRSRSALREVAKALGVPFAEATRLSTAYHRRDHGKVDAAFLAEQGIDPRSFMAKKLIEIINQIKGFPRHISTHVGGFILTREPLVESVPIQNAAMENRTVIQWAKDDLARLGMLKVDILGLGILTAIRKCLGTIGEPLTLATIPAEDPKVYDMICRADTVGVFQVESRAQMGMLPRLRPRTFHDLVIEVAIVRPGPIQGRMVHPFLRRRRGEEKVFYAHPKLEPILKKTCGVPLFQEQVMKIAMAVADFTPGEADELRRAMGIWRTRDSVKFGELREKLVGRMRNNGIAAEHALSIFHQIESFGEFGFPESHSASFALLVYASAYLKLYHPAAYAAALINSQPMGFYAPHSILDDARRHGVAVLPIDVTRSAWDLTIENGAIRLGFRLVRGMGEKAARRIEAERAKRPFESLEAFAARTGLNRGLLFHLASADAFRAFGIDRREAVWKLRALVTDGDDLHAGQPLPEPDVRFPELTDAETVTTDFAFTGTSTYAHPVSLLRDEMERLGVRRASELPKLPAGRKIRTGGLVIVRQSPPTARGMVFLTLEDETGFVNVAFRPDLYDRLRRTVSGEPFLVVEGILQRDGLATSLLASAAWGLPFEAGLPDLSRNFH